MITKIFKKFAGSHYRRFLKKAQPIVAKINQLEQEYQSLSDEQLRAKTEEFRARYTKEMDEVRARLGDNPDPERLVEANQAILDGLLPEAFATVKNAARRLCGKDVDVMGHMLRWEMVHYDVQLIGGMALHDNRIAEMATGEGKTLVSTLPLYLNALSGRNCQLCTVNEYLAERDSQWMGHLFKFLGLTVGVIKNQQPPEEKRAAYEADLTYGTASEFGFDYLRDNGMATRAEDQVQRDHYYVIVDEIDSILVDEARTPLIISGPVQDDRQAPFMELKPGIQKLVSLQTNLCTHLANTAQEALMSGDLDNDTRLDALNKLVQVKLGMPKNRSLMKLMEHGNIRRAFEKHDAEMHSDFQKKILYALKEELYYTIDEKQHQSDLTEKGRSTLRPDDPDAFVLPDLPTIFNEIESDQSLSDEEKMKEKQKEEELFGRRSEDIHCISQLLRAYALYERDKEYVIHEGKVAIVDENTGRMMPGRRWSDGLHQAVEAKEGVKIEKESKTYATITVQNYFRLYEKLAGMTGTAETEAGEFHDIYGLNVMVIPTHRPCQRIDENDVIYKTRREKYNAVIEDIKVAHEKGQPVLVGTASVEASEVLSRMLQRTKIRHSVLNAKYHQQEAEIVSQAGQPGGVTIATNMAGRGTDIKLGEGINEKGGLLVIGTERHESRRVDRQLRGRCARQGDNGRSKFFISLEDDLMRLFANAGPISKILQSSFQEGEVLAHPLLNRSIESAQKKVEQQNYSIRKRLLQYDDVLNKQREVIYGIRNDALHSESPRDVIMEMVMEELEARLDTIASGSDKQPEYSDVQGLLSWVNTHFPVAIEEQEIEGKTHAQLLSLFSERINKAYDQRASAEDEKAFKGLERYVLTRAIDKNWQDHLTEMEDLRRAVGLRGYGQKDPLVEYKAEAFTYFQDMIARVRTDICTGIFRVAIIHNPAELEAARRRLMEMQRRAQATGPENASAPGAAPAGRGPAAAGAGRTADGKPIKLPTVQPVKRELPKIGRNEVVSIRKGGQTQTLKWKKAEEMVRDEGWELVPPSETAKK
ncbi:preprotein translocase subunit SecA [Ruficoccus amylovorans]|uniref:Protein translocase subunit SecA n=1 Tax=Ruficoccus amylovorans TaxID=1804625 RepID=A0A842HAH9_9BACT|nr:preprotein translocase subunit SecA [Ruficoccus amylovorans]MBC2593139.1 preprotein translocase subunit SecA [Ruficoccus amylovorans]